ncbi:MAG TPA: pentapeptide repeat-containing protein [Actinophytocola sp.]|uniref:pentapeptide repeat-containing protein n=1 Tax=Actinophytocola sp. TaxID=1872138 RepID=UPI002DBD3FD7|nr:pentapeptide repeat-containing protein [Actinophytocola sp.]HEU5472545.1 pentapeptide repeat-containing protein [Actinophytocola sp.]
MHALERLAQGNVEHRQTIVDVLCAYLRMPYDLEHTLHAPVPGRYVMFGNRLLRLPAGVSDPDAPACCVPTLEKLQEQQVRCAAQRILTDHLRPDPDESGKSRDKFWADVDLDLSGAALVEFDLSRCQVRDVKFDGARFSGPAVFAETEFTGNAWFAGATFSNPAGFRAARFLGEAWFGWTIFSADCGFVDAYFADGAGFRAAAFLSNTWFDRAHFTGKARFNETRFTKHPSFSGTQIDQDPPSEIPAHVAPDGHQAPDGSYH